MEYHKVTLEDGKWVRPLLEATNYKTCEFAFANIYMWAELYHTYIGEYQGYALVRNIGRTHHHFLYPRQNKTFLISCNRHCIIIKLC